MKLYSHVFQQDYKIWINSYSKDFIMFFYRLIQRLKHDDAAATAIEYALIASGIAVVIAATIYGLGDVLREEYFEKIASSFQSTDTP